MAEAITLLSESAVEVISGLVTKTGGSVNTTCLLGEPILLLVLLDKFWASMLMEKGNLQRLKNDDTIFLVFYH